MKSCLILILIFTLFSAPVLASDVTNSDYQSSAIEEKEDKGAKEIDQDIKDEVPAVKEKAVNPCNGPNPPSWSK